MVVERWVVIRLAGLVLRVLGARVLPAPDVQAATEDIAVRIDQATDAVEPQAQPAWRVVHVSGGSAQATVVVTSEIQPAMKRKVQLRVFFFVICLSPSRVTPNDADLTINPPHGLLCR